VTSTYASDGRAGGPRRPYGNRPKASRPSANRPNIPPPLTSTNAIPRTVRTVRTVAPELSPLEENVKPATPEGMLTVDEAARRMAMSVRHVRRLIADRQIAHHRFGRIVRLDPADVDAFIAASRVEPIAAGS
jgi:excisionase family DNA binding protein